MPEVAGTDSHFQQEFLEIPCVLSAAREDIFLAETGEVFGHLRSQAPPEHLLKAKDLLSDRTTFMLGGAPKGHQFFAGKWVPVPTRGLAN